MIGLSCGAAMLALLFASAWGASASQPDAVHNNIQQLLKTNACPSCNLSGADLSQIRLAHADLSGANLSGAKLNLADLTGANLQEADLERADLSGADLSFADLEGANLRGTKLEGVRLQRTKIKGRTVNRLIHADNAQAEAGDDSISTTQLMAATPSSPGTGGTPDVPPTSTSLQHLPPPAAGGNGAGQPQENHSDALLPQNTDMGTDNISEARQALLEQMFDRERCIGCDLSNLDLSDRDMGGFDLERADFSGSNLRDADLGNANLKGAKFRNSLLQNADLSGADLYRADFTGADLTDADLDEAKTDGADLSGAIGLQPAAQEEVQ
jgi:uncharacterized protein YjbI with pentapeptide repeats